MKRIRSIYQSYMLRPIIYRTVSKSVFALTIVLLWDRFLNHGRFSVVRDGFFVAGAVLLLMAWFSFLALDGMTAKKLFKRGAEEQKKKPRRWGTSDIIDFADEHVTRLEELDEDERRVVFLLSSLIPGVLFVAVALVALFVM